MTKPSYKIITGKDNPKLLDDTHDLVTKGWPEFMMHDAVVDKFWVPNFEAHPELHFGLFDKFQNRYIALGNSIALSHTEELKSLPLGGLDWSLEKASDDHKNERAVNLQCALQIVVDKDLLGQGLSYFMVKTMAAIGRDHGLSGLIAPVRPTLKSRYPLTQMDDYVRWQVGDHVPFDPWMRVHTKLGANIVNVATESMRIEGTVSEWEEWTGLRFPDSGSYIIDGALVPITIDLKSDRGLYLEPNVWMFHPPA